MKSFKPRLNFTNSDKPTSQVWTVTPQNNPDHTQGFNIPFGIPLTSIYYPVQAYGSLRPLSASLAASAGIAFYTRAIMDDNCNASSL